MSSEHDSDSSEDSSDSESESVASPPRVDDSPLQKCMDRNKQSLKVKLMMRRPYTQLVDQGIMPPLKTPASFHEQRQKLQRAKMGDLLKHKIQHRPDRTELIRQHILEADTGKVDPSLAERQRMLKRARLADSLNDQLSHRPGPLELIQKNILHTDENVERAVKEGQISFRATCEGSAVRPSHPLRYVTPEADDSSSEGALSPSGSLDGCGIANLTSASPATTVASSPSSLSSVASPAVAPSPPSQLAPPPPPPPPPAVPLSVKTAVEKNRNRKKSKQKCPPKPRTIKFHEYKGPPNAQRPQPSAPSDVETSYELLLQQQQLFLQWQLEWQHKYPQIILPAKAPTENNNLATFLVQAAPPSPAAPVETPSRVRLEEMKVSDLRTELKKRNLPVSGSKPQLIDRLRPFFGEDGTQKSLSRRGSQVPEEAPSPSSNASRRVSCSSLDGSISSFRGTSDTILPSFSPTSSAASMSPSPPSVRPPSVINMDVEMNTLDGLEVKLEAPPTPPPLPEQQIDDLVRGLQEEQKALVEQQQMLREQATDEPDPKTQQRLLLQQHLQLKIQQQQIQQQLETLQQLQQSPAPSKSVSSRATARSNRNAAKLRQGAGDVRPPPPNYTEASKMLQQPIKPRVSIKSQLVDDVLDILIRNGELPPSAAHDPVTPTTARDPPLPPPLPAHLLTKQSSPPPLPTEIKFPYIDINEIRLDLDSLSEAMELGVYDNHPVTHPPAPSSSEEITAMDMDVADWLDTLLPPLAGSQTLSSGSSVASSTSSSTSGFSSLGSDQHSYLQTTQPTYCNNQSQISGDPLFSSLSSDPYTDLFALEDSDMKLPTGLGNTLSWDRLDFTA